MRTRLISVLVFVVLVVVSIVGNPNFTQAQSGSYEIYTEITLDCAGGSWEVRGTRHLEPGDVLGHYSHIWNDEGTYDQVRQAGFQDGWVVDQVYDGQVVDSDDSAPATGWNMEWTRYVYYSDGSLASESTYYLGCQENEAWTSYQIYPKASQQPDPGGSDFNPGDGRVNPGGGDRVAVYCNSDKLAVWGINNGEGFPLTTFDYANIAFAGSEGVSQDLGVNGRVSVSVSKAGDQYSFWLNWTSNQHNVSFDKSFSCHIEPVQLIAPVCNGRQIDGCTTGVLPSEAQVIFINGIQNSLTDHETSLENELSPRFSGVMGIYNGGIVSNWGNTEEASGATDTLIRFLAFTSHPVILIGHSEGGSVIAEALQALEGTSRLDNVTVYTFGSPAKNYPGNQDLHHHCTFEFDLATLGARSDGVQMNVIEGVTGHFFSHYMQYWDFCSQ